MPPVQVLLKTLVYLCVAAAVAASAASSPGLLLPPSTGTWVARRAPPAPSAAAFAPLSSDTAKCVPLDVAGGAALAVTTLDASLGASSTSPLSHRPPPPSVGLLSAVAAGSGAEGSADAGTACGTPHRLLPPNGSFPLWFTSPAFDNASLPTLPMPLPSFIGAGISRDGLPAESLTSGVQPDAASPPSPAASLDNASLPTLPMPLPSFIGAGISRDGLPAESLYAVADRSLFCSYSLQL